MIIYFIVSVIARIFMPHDVVLVNQKLKGYWLVVEDNRINQLTTDSIIVIKFDKCKRKERKDKTCVYSRSVLDSIAVSKKKLIKEYKREWNPENSQTYWVERKRNKETKRETIHLEGFSEISFSLLKKEVALYSGDSLVIRLNKLR